MKGSKSVRRPVNMHIQNDTHTLRRLNVQWLVVCHLHLVMLTHVIVHLAEQSRSAQFAYNLFSKVRKLLDLLVIMLST